MGYKINEFSKFCGVSPPKLRFYERKGYPQPERAASGYRQYTLKDAYRINTFNLLTSQGFTVTEAIDRLKYHHGDEYCAALGERNKELEQQLWLIEKKLQWNKKMQYVYSHIEYELSISRTIDLPEMVFLSCVKDGRFQESYINNDIIKQWVKLLPAALYAEKWNDFRSNELGMAVEKSIALQYGLAEENMTVLPAGTYLCMLSGDNNDSAREESFQKDPRIPKHLKQAAAAAENPDGLAVWRIFLMVGEAHHGEYLNYMLIKI